MSRPEQTPSVIRGESPAGEVLIDTVSVTMPRSEVERMVNGSVSGWTSTNEEIIARFQVFLDWLFGARIFECTAIGGRRNNFDQTVLLDNKTGFIAWGGNNKKLDGQGNTVEFVEERVQLYVDGDGCARQINWALFAQRLGQLRDWRITRCDVAFDDHEGRYTVQQAVDMYDAGEFASSGRPPKARYIDDKGSGEGKTLYVGRRESGKMLRCYEKGKQLGDPLSPWVRWEVEFGNKDREIPLEIFTDPAAFLAGSYPALSFISTVRLVIRTCREKLAIQFDQLMKIARHQYGKLLNFAHAVVGLDPLQVFDELINRADFPQRLKWSLNVNRELNHVAC